MLKHKGTIDLETNNFILRPFTSEDIPDMYYNWAIEDKYTKHVIGSINLANLDNYNENCEIGYCIGKNFWNQGIMTEVLNQVIEFALVEVNFERITARRHINNIALGMLLKKCRFVYEGTLRNADLFMKVL